MARIPLRLALFATLGMLAGALGTVTLVNWATVGDWAMVDGATARSLAWRLESAEWEQLLVMSWNSADDRGRRRYGLVEPSAAPVIPAPTDRDPRRSWRGGHQRAPVARPADPDRQHSASTASVAGSSGHVSSLDVAATLAQESAQLGVARVDHGWAAIGTLASPIVPTLARPASVPVGAPRRVIRLKAGRAFPDETRRERSRRPSTIPNGFVDRDRTSLVASDRPADVGWSHAGTTRMALPISQAKLCDETSAGQ